MEKKKLMKRPNKRERVNFADMDAEPPDMPVNGCLKLKEEVVLM